MTENMINFWRSENQYFFPSGFTEGTNHLASSFIDGTHQKNMLFYLSQCFSFAVYFQRLYPLEITNAITIVLSFSHVSTEGLLWFMYYSTALCNLTNIQMLWVILPKDPWTRSNLSKSLAPPSKGGWDLKDLFVCQGRLSNVCCSASQRTGETWRAPYLPSKPSSNQT